MSDPRLDELIQGEVDGELDTSQRAELAQRLLADPDARAERERVRRLCGLLDEAGRAEPPADLAGQILAALPQPDGPTSRHEPHWLTTAVLQPWSSAHRWRYAAVAAGVLVAGTIVFSTVRAPGVMGDLSGTMAAPEVSAKLDEVRLAGEAVSGRVGLYRSGKALQVRLEVRTAGPVDIVVTAGGQTRRINGFAGPSGSAATTIDLPQSLAAAPVIEVTLLMAGEEVGAATLRASGSR